MRTMITISLIVLAAVATVVTAGLLIFLYWGWPLLVAFFAVGIVLFVGYALIVHPWVAHWGATDEEVSRALPGDEIIPGARSTTRVISIAATPEDIWPWLTQIGYGRAGWYSYDWIDNDGKPSADEIRPELQQFDIGREIVMVPGMGPVVREVVPERYFVAGDEKSGTWCVWLAPIDASHTRLISRWRQNWKITPASAFWIAIVDPGAFIMEQKMLRGIKARAEGLRAHLARS